MPVTADMESISDRIGSCSLYAGTPPQYTSPKYISAFGELALVHPPPKPHPTPIESQKLTGRGGKTSGKQTTKRVSIVKMIHSYVNVIVYVYLCFLRYLIIVVFGLNSLSI